MAGVGAGRGFLGFVGAGLAVTIVVGAALSMFYLLPRTPSAVRLHGVAGDGNVKLSWRTRGAADRIVNWEYEKKSEGRGYGASTEVPDSKIVEGLVNGRYYGFRVRGKNAHGWGAWSNEVAAVPRASVVEKPERGVALQVIVETAARIERKLVELRDWSSRGEGEGNRTFERRILPVHLQVHFENAELDVASGELSGRGVVLTSMQRSLLRSTVNTLGSCTLERGTVRIRPYGFASSAPFAGVPNSDELNVTVANRRAAAVHDALVRMSADEASGNLHIEAPVAWRNFDEMQAARNRCVTASRDGRNSFPGRVVVLQLEGWGACTPVGGVNLMPRCEA